jgi:hypothetical protein
MIIIDHVPDRKIEHALQLVKECVTGKRGFCYKEVHRYPLHSGSELRNEMVRLKRERMAVNTLPRRIEVINRKLKDMRIQEREHYLFDTSAFTTLRSNYNRLSNALALLQQEGEIDSYTVRPNGELRVNWFTEFEETQLEVIQQGWTWSVDPNNPYHSQSQMVTRMYRLYNTIPQTKGDEGVPIRKMDEIIPQGMIVKRKEDQVTKGSGELSPAILKQRDADAEYNRVQQKALYIQAGEQRKVDTHA